MKEIWNKYKKPIIAIGVVIAAAAVVKLCPFGSTTLPCIVSFAAGAAACYFWGDDVE
ncbi:MAG: hypothetical protein R3Y68_09465 [Rikenellaceae bacterium]